MRPLETYNEKKYYSELKMGGIPILRLYNVSPISLGSDYLEVPYLWGKKLFGGTVPPRKKNYLEVPVIFFHSPSQAKSQLKPN